MNILLSTMEAMALLLMMMLVMLWCFLAISIAVREDDRGD
jgi:hypothetical protein